MSRIVKTSDRGSFLVTLKSAILLVASKLKELAEHFLGVKTVLMNGNVRHVWDAFSCKASFNFIGRPL